MRVLSVELGTQVWTWICGVPFVCLGYAFVGDGDGDRWGRSACRGPSVLGA